MSTPNLTADDITLPIKRTDGDTLEDRLTDNAYHNILPARYLKKDANGNLAETQEELFERVAKNIALADAVYAANQRDIDITVTPNQLKPNHPRRDELAADVFGNGTTADADATTTLTEHNVNKFAYDTIVPDLPAEIKAHVEHVAAEFQDLMENLSFIPNCVPPDSLVAAEGGLKPLTSIEPGERVHDDVDGDARVESKYENGEKLVVEIETEAGYTVRATPEHYFRVITESGNYDWKQVKDIKETDVIALQSDFLDDTGGQVEFNPIEVTDGGVITAGQDNHATGRPRAAFDEPDEMTPDLAEWLGLYVGDGTARHSGVRVAFDSQDEDVLDVWLDLTESIFGFEATRTKLDAKGCLIGGAYRRDLYEFLDRNDLLKESSVSASIPDAVLQSGRTCIARFLRGLFESDGTVGERAIEFYTHSESLAKTVQLSLLGLGIHSKLRPKRDGYRLSIRKNRSGKRFVERIGFIGKRKGLLARHYEDVSANATTVKIPNQTKRLHDWFKQSDLGLEAYRDLSQFLINPDSKYHQEISRRMFTKYAEKYPELWDSPVAEFIGRNQHYEQVSTVREIGTMAVEDMQVPRRSTYVVEGFVSHNSPTLMNAGDELQQLSACFVMSPDDDLTDIHETAKKAAQVFQSGGGVGYAFWKLRPYGDPVGSTGGIASGPLTFMETYDQLCETIAQGGTRRGAQMAIMRISHPDVVEFIHAKNKDVSLAHSLRLNDPDDYTYTSFNEALEEARSLIDDEGRVPEHLRNAVEGHLSNFNISVGVTDDFMDALRNDDDYTFINPRTGDPHVATEHTKEMYERYDLGDYVEVGDELTLPAAVLWERIIEGAWENGEPGVVYLDRINDEHSFPVESTPTGDSSKYEILATNPCVTGETLISTENGLIPAEKLYEQGVARDIVVDGRLSNDRIKEASSVYKTGEKDVYKLKTEEGYELRLTEDHRVMTEDGWVEAQDLKPSDTVHIQNRKGEFGQHGSAEEGRVLGWLVGDGHLKDGEERAVLNFYDEDTEFSETFAADVNDIVREPVGTANYEVGVMDISRSDDYRGPQAIEQRIRSARLYEMAEELGLTEEKLQVPDAVMHGSEEMARGFLRALFTADGGVQGTMEKGNSVRLTSTSRDLLKQVQTLLLNFGIASKIYENRREADLKDLPDGNGGMKKYKTKAQHDLVIAKDNLVRFHDEIGFLLDSKNEALDKRLESYDRGPYAERFEATVASVEPDGHEAVFDLTEPDTHSFVANGLVVHNCGEQPLIEYEACNLGHINLSTVADMEAPDWRVWFAEHGDSFDSLEEAVGAFLEEAIDGDELEYRVEWGTRFLENVVAMSDFPVEQIEETVFRNRKIGLGIMGLAQLFIQLGMEYGSDPANEVARQVMQRINHGSKWTSHELAAERGSFANWGDSKYADPVEYRAWFEHQTGLDADEWADGFPIRNHNTTTIAPTGTTGMVGNTTGGCEPIYNVAFYKNVSDDVQGDEMLVEFDDYFLRVLEGNDIDVAAVKEEAEAQMANNEFEGVSSLSTVPDAIGELFVVTADISAKEHAAVQCACQAGVDSAISKTVNAPHESTVADAKEVFEFIHENGGKGVTYYRDGTRSKQVLTTRAQNTDYSSLKADEAAAVLVEQIEEVFGGIEGFLEHDAVRERVEADIRALVESGERYVGKRDRPDVLYGVTQRIDTGYGKLYVNINHDDEGRPFELFANIGDSGGFTASFTESLGKTISTALRSGVDPEEIADELQGIRSPKVAWDKGEQIQSIPDAVGTALRRYLDGELDRAHPQQQTLEETAADEDDDEVADDAKTDGGPAAAEDAVQSLIDAGESPECPDCGSMSLYFSEGCKTCASCGWSEC